VRNTGKILKGSRWTSGIHQFVEIKHGIPVDKESLSPLSLSHPVYYEMVDRMFGLSGTLGSQFEREEIRAIYGADSFDVPPHNPSLRVDQKPTLVASSKDILTKTLEAVRSCKANGRPILISCETIRFSEEVSDLLSAQGISHEMLNEAQEKSEKEILSRAGAPGAVTVATTAGRGTDIRLEAESIKNGGLHSLLTFFPDSLRVGGQVRGRAGRQGQPGSSEILCASTVSLDLLLEQKELRAQLMKDHHIYIAKMARYRFDFARKFFALIATFHKAREKQQSSLARNWGPRSLVTLSPNLDKLSLQDAQIAGEVLSLLTRSSDPKSNSWEVLIDTIHQRVQTLAIQDWAVRFQQAAEAIISDFNIEKLIQFKFDLNRIDPSMTEEISKIMQTCYEELINTIKELFLKRSALWEKCLGEDGAGINGYIQQIAKGIPPNLDSF